MNIVLSILQILGITLLIAFAIVVFAVMFILFAPLFYQLEGDIHETKWAKAKVSWLLHLIRARISYEDDLLYGEVGIFWKKMTFSYEFTNLKEEENSEEVEQEKTKEPAKESKTASEETWLDKIKNFVQKIKDIYPRLKQIITDDRNKQAVVHLKKELLYFIKILLPKKSRLNASFSTGSPDTTGQLCGVIACFPVMYQKGWALRPDFTAEEAYFQGDFWGKGSIYAFQLVGILLRIIFDKNCRRMYTMIDRLLKRMKKKPNQEGK